MLLLALKRLLANGLFLALFVGIITSCNYSNSEDGLEPLSIQDSVVTILNEVQEGGNSQSVIHSKLLRAHRLIDDIEVDSIRLNALEDIAIESFSIQEYELTKKASQDLQDYALRIKDTLGIANSYYYLGNYHLAQEESDSAVNKFYYAERFYELLGDNLNAGKAVLNLAIVQKNLKDYIGGERSTIKALQFFTSLDKTPDRLMGSAYSNLGIIAKDTERYDLAVDYHSRALEYRKKLNNKALEVSTLNNIGIVYTKKGEYNKAIEFFDQGISYDSLFFKRPKTYARLLDNKAFARFMAGEREGYPEEFLMPMRFRDSVNDRLGLVTSYLHLSDYFLVIDSLKQSQEYALMALQQSRDVSYQRGEQESLTLLSKNSDPEQALAYNNMYIAINDSLQLAERVFQDRFTRLRYETDIITSDRNKVAQTNKKLVVILLSLIAFALMGYILIQRRVNQRELKFQADQQKANEEIYSLMLSQKVKLEEGKQMEKQRISEELHDGILSKLFGARLSLDSLNAKVDDKSVGIRTSYIEELKNIESEIRSISHELNASGITQDVMYVDAVEKLLQDQCTIHSIDFELTSDNVIDWERMSNNKKVHLYRIIQEALQNIMKHAQAKEVSVQFAKVMEGVRLTITDNGVGMNTLRIKKGIGLKNIKSRVRQIQGRLDINSEIGKGTKITVNFAV